MSSINSINKNSSSSITSGINNKFSWVFVVWGKDKYLVGAIVAALSLRKVNTQYDITLMYALDNDLSTETINKLTQENTTEHPLFNSCIKIPLQKITTIQPKTRRQQELYGGYFSQTSITKWSCLNLIQYNKICFVDIDIIFLQNPDKLFETQAPAACFSNPYTHLFSRNGIRSPYPHLKHNQIVNTSDIIRGLDSIVCSGGMVILEPKAGEFDKMLEWVNSHTMYGHSNCYSGIDEQIITEWTTKNNIKWTHIDPIYQLIPWQTKWVPEVKGDYTKAIGLHFYHDKPWEKGQSQGWPDIQLWWNLFKQLPTDIKAFTSSLIDPVILEK